MLRSNPVAPWELRIGKIRVYYDTEKEPEPTVFVRAVGLKERNLVRIGREVIHLWYRSRRPTLEAVALGKHPDFLALIERSRARQRAEGGISSEEMRRRLGLKPKRPAAPHGR